MVDSERLQGVLFWGFYTHSAPTLESKKEGKEPICRVWQTHAMQFLQGLVIAGRITQSYSDLLKTRETRGLLHLILVVSHSFGVFLKVQHY